MKKRDFKALVLMGIASGAMIVSQNAGAVEVNTNLESTFLAGGGGCGGGGACGSSPAPQRSWNNSGNGCSNKPHNNNNNDNQTTRQRNTYQQQPTQQTSNQKNTRYTRQIAEGDEIMPIDETTTQPPRHPSGCSGATGCSGKSTPRQYRTRN